MFFYNCAEHGMVYNDACMKHLKSIIMDANKLLSIEYLFII